MNPIEALVEEREMVARERGAAVLAAVIDGRAEVGDCNWDPRLPVAIGDQCVCLGALTELDVRRWIRLRRVAA